MVWKPIFRRITPFRRISPQLKDRLLRPWLYPHVEPKINLKEEQIEALLNGVTIVHDVDLDEEAILKAFRDKEETV